MTEESAALDRVAEPMRGRVREFADLLKELAGEGAEALRHKHAEDYRQRFANPYVAAERGYVDEVIEPARTRPKLIAALRLLENKRDQNPPRKHGNIPL